mmetsp:Transcript_41815/g.67819  ORF Transcript_41815/g.67819 Transcript_41815/m.67819 type:complete len:202 (+) Transcript_41815:2-607(+)
MCVVGGTDYSAELQFVQAAQDALSQLAAVARAWEVAESADRHTRLWTDRIGKSRPPSSRPLKQPLSKPDADAEGDSSGEQVRGEDVAWWLPREVWPDGVWDKAVWGGVLESVGGDNEAVNKTPAFTYSDPKELASVCEGRHNLQRVLLLQYVEQAVLSRLYDLVSSLTGDSTSQLLLLRLVHSLLIHNGRQLFVLAKPPTD